MVDLTRRKMIVGMGLLAGGSGASFSSASITDSTTPESDLRVVTDASLTVRAGNLFSNASGDDVKEITSPGGDINYAAYIGDSENTNYGSPGDVLFSSDDAGGSLTSSTVTDTSDPIETPAVIANGGEDDDFAFAVAVAINDDVEFSELIEVENTTSSSEDIGIIFDTFGTDAPSVGGGSDTGEEIVGTGVYEFYAGSSTSTKISTNNTGWHDDSSTDQTPANFVSVGSGNTQQITMNNDTGGGSVSVGDLRSAAGSSGFGQNNISLDLVDSIEIGVDSST